MCIICVINIRKRTIYIYTYVYTYIKGENRDSEQGQKERKILNKALIQVMSNIQIMSFRRKQKKWTMKENFQIEEKYINLKNQKFPELKNKGSKGPIKYPAY